jgi:hypothetical protein
LDENQENTVVFGWQFRPVLGADFVKGGRRQVFAQIALSEGVDSLDSPRVFVQTVWRDYNKLTQVVGGVLENSCHVEADSSATTLVDEPLVRDMFLTDLGGGQVKLTADGDFFSASLNILSGSNTSVPLAFDGKEVEVFGAAHDLLENGDLTIVGANGRHSPFAIKAQNGKNCGIASAKLSATPRSDGNSLAKLELTMGSDFNPAPNQDGGVRPLVLIGKQVYGIREFPFLRTAGEDPCQTNKDKADKSTTDENMTDKRVVCTYSFVAPTTDIRNAETFLARDLTWQGMSATGKIEFSPSFAALAKLSPDPVADTTTKTTDAQAPTIFSVTGFDLKGLALCPAATTSTKQPAGSSSKPCLEIWVDGKPNPDGIGFRAIDNNFAKVDLPAPPKSKRLQFVLDFGGADSVVWDLALPAATAAKPSPSVAFLREGDSQTITFSNVTLKGVSDGSTPAGTVTFESCSLTGIYHSSKNTLDVAITSCVTGHIGHKELSAKGTSGDPVSLPIDVVRQ